ncbi:hypothetical protein D3C75_1067430 [compost metagenome]
MNSGRSRHITTTTLNFDTHADSSVFIGQVADHVLRLDDFDITIMGNVGSGHRANARFIQGKNNFIFALNSHRQPFQVEQDLQDIFLYAFFGAVLVQYTINLNLGHRATRHR